MKFLIVGAGPSGLFSALLLKRSMPDASVEVIERGARGVTIGFGVAFTSSGLEHLAPAAPDIFASIEASLWPLHGQRFILEGVAVDLPAMSRAGAIERLQLLKILTRACEAADVRIRYETRVETLRELAPEYDLVVAADGAGSSARRELADRLGQHVGDQLGNRMAWFGVRRAYDRPTLSFKAVPGGVAIGHYYPYAADMSTFVAELDSGAFTAAGLADMDPASAKSTAEKLFMEDLGEHELVDNNSFWRSYAPVSLGRWHAANIVVIGDAARPAHPSIGQGCRLAMWDAMMLVEALRETGEVGAALDSFEAGHKHRRERMNAAATASFLWYEDVGAKLRWDIKDFVGDYLGRTGRLDPNDIRALLENA